MYEPIFHGLGIIFRCKWSGRFFFSVDVHLFRYVWGKKVDEWDKSPVPLSLLTLKSIWKTCSGKKWI